LGRNDLEERIAGLALNSPTRRQAIGRQPDVCRILQLTNPCPYRQRLVKATGFGFRVLDLLQLFD